MQQALCGKAIHLYSVDYDDCFPFASSYFDTISVRLGIMPPDAFGRWSSIPTIKDLLAVYRMPGSVWVSQSDPGELKEPNPLPEEHRMSYQYLLSNPCTGALSSIEEPNRSSFIRERGPFRRGQALNFRVDGSTKILNWQESGDEAERFRGTYSCHEQSLLHR